MTTLQWVVGGAAGLAALVLASKRSLRDRSVLHLGDSHVGGLKGPLGTRVSASGGRYQAHFRVGISTSQAASSGWDEIVRRARPDVVIVTLGTNDVPSERSREATISLMTQIRRAAPSSRIVWWGPPVLLRQDIVDRPAELVRLQRPEVLIEGGLYVDSRRYTAHDHAPDGVHFTRAGYESWATRALRATFWA